MQEKTHIRFCLIHARVVSLLENTQIIFWLIHARVVSLFCLLSVSVSTSDVALDSS